MRLPSTKGATVLAVLFMMPTSPSGRAQNETFTLAEATIADIHAAMKRGDLTAARLVRMYLARIEAYDQTGPSLNTVIMVNPDAVARAEELDVRFEQSGLNRPASRHSDFTQRQREHRGHAHHRRLAESGRVDPSRRCFHHKTFEGSRGHRPGKGQPSRVCDERCDAQLATRPNAEPV